MFETIFFKEKKNKSWIMDCIDQSRIILHELYVTRTKWLRLVVKTKPDFLKLIRE